MQQRYKERWVSSNSATALVASGEPGAEIRAPSPDHTLWHAGVRYIDTLCGPDEFPQTLHLFGHAMCRHLWLCGKSLRATTPPTNHPLVTHTLPQIAVRSPCCECVLSPSRPTAHQRPNHQTHPFNPDGTSLLHDALTCRDDLGKGPTKQPTSRDRAKLFKINVGHLLILSAQSSSWPFLKNGLPCSYC